MKFIAIDIESNQPSGQVLQVGAASFDTDFDVFGTFNAFLKIDEEINWDYDLSNGQTLGELLAWDEKHYNNLAKDKATEYVRFWEWLKDQQCGKRIVQWGGYDLDSITAECESIKVKYPHRLQSINAKQIYKNLYKPARKIKGTAGLGSVIKELGLTFQGTQHDALDDAINCGIVFREMYRDLETFYKVKKLITP